MLHRLTSVLRAEETLYRYKLEYFDCGEEHEEWYVNSDAVDILDLIPLTDRLRTDICRLTGIDFNTCCRADRGVRFDDSVRMAITYVEHYDILHGGYATVLLYTASGKTITWQDLCEHEVFIRACLVPVPKTFDMDLVRYWRTLQIYVPLLRAILPADGTVPTIRAWTGSPLYPVLSDLVRTRTVVLDEWRQMVSGIQYVRSRKMGKLIKMHNNGGLVHIIYLMSNLDWQARELVAIPVMKTDDCHRFRTLVLEFGKQCRELGMHDPWNFPIFVDKSSSRYSLGDLVRDHPNATPVLRFVDHLLINMYRRYTTMYHLFERAVQERCANIFQQLDHIELKNGSAYS
jgi:hypothetical protein